MYLNIWNESNRKKRGIDFVTAYAYAMEMFHELQKKDIAFLCILLLSVPAHWPSGLSVCQWSMIPGSNPRWRHTKGFKNGTPCLTLSNIRYISRVKWSNPGKGVVPNCIPWCSSYWKGSLRVTLDYGHQLYLQLLYIMNHNTLKPISSKSIIIC